MERGTLLFLLSLAFGISFAKPHGRVHIQEGKPATAHSHPWLLRLRIGKSHIGEGEWLCGGSLIRVSDSANASDIVLTAAHCINAKGPCYQQKHLFQKCRVIAGDQNLYMFDKGEKEVKVVDGNCHDSWNPPTQESDIAVLKLAEPIQFTDTIQPIDLPQQGELLKAGTTCKFAGWGATGYNLWNEKLHPRPPGLSAVLQELELQIADDEECAVENTEPFDKEQMMCHVAKGAGHLLPGDSGGPLVCQKGNKPVVYGVASNVFSNDVDKLLGDNYMEVSYFVDWIEKTIENLKN